MTEEKVNKKKEVKFVSLGLTLKTLSRMDRVCKETTLSRAQIVNLLFSDNNKDIDYIIERIKTIDD